MKIMEYIRDEFQVIQERDPAIKTKKEVLLYPMFWAVLYYRVAHKWYLKGHFFRARWLSQRTARKTGIEIHPGATIGKGFFIDHGTGVVIGETTIIGDNVSLYQGVTLGGTGKEHGKRHPTLGDNVMVSAGAKILGSFTIGENSKIGAGSVVLKEVPPNCTVVGVPGRVVKRNDKKVPQSDLDQVNLPDPVMAMITDLHHHNELLQDEIDRLQYQVEKLQSELDDISQLHQVPASTAGEERPGKEEESSKEEASKEEKPPKEKKGSKGGKAKKSDKAHKKDKDKNKAGKKETEDEGI